MEFYDSIADYYDQIFPLNRAQVKFVLERIAGPEHSTILDIGCGTGNLSVALSEQFNKIIAIDLDKKMLDIAIEKNTFPDSLSFSIGNMLEIASDFEPATFDAVLCFGNTLVHLDSIDQISDFLHQANNVLKPGGKLLVQIINYNRILDQGIDGLPTIETDDLRFVRNYTYRNEDHKIQFDTTLEVKSHKQSIKNSVDLYPLRQEEIEQMLKKNGFTDIGYYGNFKMEQLAKSSIPFVFEATKS